MDGDCGSELPNFAGLSFTAPPSFSIFAAAPFFSGGDITGSSAIATSTMESPLNLSGLLAPVGVDACISKPSDGSPPPPFSPLLDDVASSSISALKRPVRKSRLRANRALRARSRPKAASIAASIPLRCRSGALPCTEASSRLASSMKTSSSDEMDIPCPRSPSSAAAASRYRRRAANWGAASSGKRKLNSSPASESSSMRETKPCSFRATSCAYTFVFALIIVRVYPSPKRLFRKRAEPQQRTFPALMIAMRSASMSASSM